MDIREREKVIQMLEDPFVICLGVLLNTRPIKTDMDEFITDFKKLVEFCGVNIWYRMVLYVEHLQEHNKLELRVQKREVALQIYNQFIKPGVENRTAWEIERISIYIKVVLKSIK